MATPITEEINELTRNIDVVSSPKDIITLFEKCDSQIFNGWGDFASSQNLLSPRVLESITLVQRQVELLLEDPGCNNQIVISGCGTSGRLAFLAVRYVKNVLFKTLENTKRPCSFKYIIAGGDRALFTSQETFEDDPVVGAEVLRKIASAKKRVLYIGITCGLSAPFVAGQIDFCLKNLNIFTPVLIGFNPANLARMKQMEKLGNRSFYDLMENYLKAVLKGAAFLINPVVGPEAICGSSRMKGGTATKIILETIFTGAFYHVSLNPSKPFGVEKWIRSYENVCKDVYKQTENLSQVIKWSGQALNKAGGHIYYVGERNIGIMGLIDASECPPTFGADFNDCRGFLCGGYTSLLNDEGDLTCYGEEEYSISLDYFQKKTSRSLRETDLVVFLVCNSNMESFTSFVSKIKCKVVVANFLWKVEEIPVFRSDQQITINFCIPYQNQESMVGSDVAKLWCQPFCEMAAKIFLNSISTSAHILKGKVFENLMIDMKPSNNKLFHRSLGIIQRFSRLSETKSLEFLLRSIYETDILTDAIMAASVESHVIHSLGKKKIVPIALVASLKNCPIQKAKEILEKEPIIRNAITASLNLKL